MYQPRHSSYLWRVIVYVEINDQPILVAHVANERASVEPQMRL